MSEQLQKKIKDRARRTIAITFTVMSVLFGVIPTIVCWVLKQDAFLEFFGLTIIFIVISVVYWAVPINVTRNLPEGFANDVLIRIEGDRITQRGLTGVKVMLLSKVKKVVDEGDAYIIKFRLGNVNNDFICQKDLLKQGTLEEFEALFVDKLVRNYKY